MFAIRGPAARTGLWPLAHPPDSVAQLRQHHLVDPGEHPPQRRVRLGRSEQPHLPAEMLDVTARLRAPRQHRVQTRQEHPTAIDRNTHNRRRQRRR